MVLYGTIDSLIDFFSFTAWIFYGGAMVALIVMRRTKPNSPRPYKVQYITTPRMITHDNTSHSNEFFSSSFTGAYYHSIFGLNHFDLFSHWSNYWQTTNRVSVRDYVHIDWTIILYSICEIRHDAQFHGYVSTYLFSLISDQITEPNRRIEYTLFLQTKLLYSSNCYWKLCQRLQWEWIKWWFLDPASRIPTWYLSYWKLYMRKIEKFNIII